MEFIPCMCTCVPECLRFLNVKLMYHVVKCFQKYWGIKIDKVKFCKNRESKNESEDEKEWWQNRDRASIFIDWFNMETDWNPFHNMYSKKREKEREERKFFDKFWLRAIYTHTHIKVEAKTRYLKFYTFNDDPNFKYLARFFASIIYFPSFSGSRFLFLSFFCRCCWCCFCLF